MARLHYDIVAFDLDGTLLDTSGELTASVNHVLAGLGRPALAHAEVRPMVGLGARYMLARALERTGGGGEALVAEWLPALLDHYGANLGSDSPPFPGLVAAMDALDAAGARLAVVTNKYERFALTLLERIGMLGRFAAVVGGDTMGKGKAKPHPAPVEEAIRRCRAAGAGPRAVMIGDSIYDVEAARAAGIPAVAVAFGFLHQPVDELGADAVIDHYDELLPTLERMACDSGRAGA